MTYEVLAEPSWTGSDAEGSATSFGAAAMCEADPSCCLDFGWSLALGWSIGGSAERTLRDSIIRDSFSVGLLKIITARPAEGTRATANKRKKRNELGRDARNAVGLSACEPPVCGARRFASCDTSSSSDLNPLSRSLLIRMLSVQLGTHHRPRSLRLTRRATCHCST